jgi:hypothetical protein
MNYIKALITSLIVSLSVFAESDGKLNASVEAGYTSHYLVNGLAKTGGEVFAGLDIGTTYKTVDVYLGATVLPTVNGFEESHWSLGAGHTFSLFSNVGLRFDVEGIRHFSSLVGGKNSTEVAPKLALQNPIATPYIRGSYDFDTEQQGYAVGLTRPTSVFGWFTLTPTVEYGKYTDYEALAAKVAVSRVFFGHLEPFAEVGWYDNNFSASKYTISSTQLSGDVIAMGGIRWKF